MSNFDKIYKIVFRRKNDSVGNQNLLTLFTDRLLLHASCLSLATYNVLFEILIEHMTPSISYVLHSPIMDSARFENPVILKVIANLITQSELGPELIKVCGFINFGSCFWSVLLFLFMLFLIYLQVKKAFLNDILIMCEHSRENRRTILQMSVWQEWLISLAHIFPSNSDEISVSDLVFRIFSHLLFHAIRLEYGGWRVWVDTLAIAHSKVNFLYNY